MNDRSSGGFATPQALDEELKRRSRADNGDAARRLLARGRTVSYLDRDTPAGHVIRKHPDGRLELVKVELGTKNLGTAR